MLFFDLYICHSVHVAGWRSCQLIVACSVISSRIDYCNSLLYDGAPVAVVEKLQRAQNTTSPGSSVSSSGVFAPDRY